MTDLGYRQVTAEGCGRPTTSSERWPPPVTPGRTTASLATGDRDSLQLVSETTTVLLATTALGRSKTVAMDVAAIEESTASSPSSSSR